MFSLFDVALAHEVPFGIPQYVQCILHGLTSVLLCVPFIFADSEKCRFGGSYKPRPRHNLKHNLRMAQGTKCPHAICDYMRKVKLKYQHVMSIITGYNSHFEVHVTQ